MPVPGGPVTLGTAAPCDGRDAACGRGRDAKLLQAAELPDSCRDLIRKLLRERHCHPKFAKAACVASCHSEISY